MRNDVRALMFAEQYTNLDVCEAAPGRRVPFAPRWKGCGARRAERDQAQAGPGSAVTAEICALNLKRKLHKYTKMCILFI